MSVEMASPQMAAPVVEARQDKRLSELSPPLRSQILGYVTKNSSAANQDGLTAAQAEMLTATLRGTYRGLKNANAKLIPGDSALLGALEGKAGALVISARCSRDASLDPAKKNEHQETVKKYQSLVDVLAAIRSLNK